MVLTLGAPVTAGQAVQVGYTDPTAGNDPNAIQDIAGMMQQHYHQLQ
ncbi:hypothetical protein ACINWC743_A0104 [Acinetobacter sp. WC-743]|nr:hypothetical protein ACINWC743_A0104 [Acinetobacter sp. WC-743]